MYADNGVCQHAQAKPCLFARIACLFSFLSFNFFFYFFILKAIRQKELHLSIGKKNVVYWIPRPVYVLSQSAKLPSYDTDTNSHEWNVTKTP